MNRFGRLLRNLLLFALVGWAGVDDYLPVFGSLSDSSAEIGDSVQFDRQSQTLCGRRNFRRRPSAHAWLIVQSGCRRPSRRPGRADPGTALATSDHLYALMSLRR